MGEPVLDLAEVLTISVGESRKSTNWRMVKLTWDQLVDKMREPVVTRETVKEFHEMNRDQQSNIKDVGGFVGGTLEGARLAGNVKDRTVMCFDADYAGPDLWDNWQLMVGCAALIHSTHKHTPKAPRLRIIVPLKRAVLPDEYEPIARKVASWLDIEAFDDTTYDINRLMFWPSKPSDGEYVFDVLDGEWLDPDKVLAMYDDWHDMREWPRSSRQDTIIRKMGQKQGDPLTKPGVIGAFNRAYSISEAIEKYLPSVYTPAGGDRYTYVGGTTFAGAKTYDDGTFLYSWHDHDPVHNRLCNAFDLVRLHLYGDQDAGQDVAVAELPSQKAMKALCMGDEKVCKELERAIRMKPDEAFKKHDNLERFVDDYTEQGSALMFVDLYGDNLRYSKATGWLFWDGQTWNLDAEAEASMLMLAMADHLYDQAYMAMQSAADKNEQARAKAEMARAGKLRTTKGRTAVLSTAAIVLHEKHPEEYDANGWDLNTPDGIIDLRTGQIRAHDMDAKCTKITACGLGTTPEGVKMWNDFIRHITGGDVDFMEYLQTLAGMAAVGNVYEEGLVISYGPGGNGKSTFFGAISKVLGSYAKGINADSLAPTYGHPDLSYVTALRGIRLAVMGETEENARMSTSLLKRITSRDKITGRALYKDPIEFDPTHTTIMHTNHLPRLNSLDGGTKRRIAVAPFLAKLTPEDVITNYENRLVTEAGGAILIWIVAGAVKFYNAQCKLKKPSIVQQATDDYLRSEDTVQQWIDECCEEVPDYREQAGALYASFCGWAKRNNVWERNSNNFSYALVDKGYETVRSHGVLYRVGLKLAGDEARV